MSDEFEIIDEDVGPEERLKRLRERLAAVEKERKEYLDGWQRAKADLVNFRRDEASRLQDGLSRAENRIIQKVLPVLDSFDRALGDIHKEHLSEEVERGFGLIRTQFAEILKQMGLMEIPSIGRPFDPALHEAVGEEESPEPGGTVTQELEKGYQRNGETVRPSRVKLAMYK
jgi:molecular chaperone GrpE